MKMNTTPLWNKAVIGKDKINNLKKHTTMTHRKHTKRPKGELVATTADPQKKQAKCKIAYNNRQKFKKEYVNVPISITIDNYATAQVLVELKKERSIKYFATLLSIRKELNAFEAAEYLKRGFKVEIVEE